MRTYEIPIDAETPRQESRVSRPPRGATLAAFFELRGYRVIEAAEVFWTRHGESPFYCSLPDHLLIDAEPEEMDLLTRKTGIRFLRHATANGAGLASGLYYCNPREYDIKKLSRQSRANIERGMQECEVRRVDPRDLLAEGIELNLDTLKRQNRRDPEFEDPLRWKRFVESVSRCPQLEVRGSYVKGRLSSYMVSCSEGGWFQMLYGVSRTEALVHRPNHAMDYSAICDAARDPAIRIVANSYVHVVGDGNLDCYKRRMGFSVAPLSLAFRLHPALAPLLANRAAVAAARVASRVRPNDYRWQFKARVLEQVRIDGLSAAGGGR